MRTSLLLCLGILGAGVANAHVTARMGDTTSSENYRQVFVFSKEKISNAEIKIGKAVNWLPLTTFKSPDHTVYGSESFVNGEKGQEFTLRASLPDGSRFTDQLTVVEDTKVRVEPGKVETKDEVAKAKKEEAAVAPVQSQSSPAGPNSGSIDARYGGAQYSAQEVAQARANYMAMYNVQGHIDGGGGALQTSQGVLSEGTGWGTMGSNPGTCVAVNGTAAVADASAFGNGMQYRVRLYNSPGTMYP